MQDSCVDPINDAAAEAQYVSVEIDTQATDRYDDTSPDTEAFKQVIAPRAPPISNPEPRFTVPLDQDIPELDFKFTKPAHKTLILRPTKPSADIATAPLRRVVTPTSGTSSDAQEGSYTNKTTNEGPPIGEAKKFSRATIGNEAELVVEVAEKQRPALKEKDSNAKSSGNIPARQQKRGASFTAGQLDIDRQLIQPLRPQQTRQFTSMPLPFPDIQPRTRRESISFKDNDRSRKLTTANMLFPEASYPANPHPPNSQRMQVTSKPISAHRSGRKRNLVAVDSCVNLQNMAQISPKFSVERGNLNDLADVRGPITHSRETAQYCRETGNISDELPQRIQALIENEKQKLLEQIQEKDAKINEISKKNEDYREDIGDLKRTNASLSERFAMIREKADSLDERLKSQLEEYKSLENFVTKHKSQTAECRQEAENMKTSFMKVKKGLESLQLYQKDSEVKLDEAKILAMNRMSSPWNSAILLIRAIEIKSFNSLKEHLNKYEAQLQQEKNKSKLLQQELMAQHEDKGLKDTIKGLLDCYYLSVTDKLAIQESKLSEAISNTDKKNQSRLSNCLRLLESSTEKPLQVPKEILEMSDLIKTLSISITDRLQGTDDGSENLRDAGTEVMEALKARVETLFEIEDIKKGLEEWVSSLQLANARLEVTTQGQEERVLELQARLSAKESELDRCRADSKLESERNQAQSNDWQRVLDKCQSLTAKYNELQKAQVKMEAESIAQNELAILQAAHDMVVSDLADATKRFRDSQAALAEQGEIASVMQMQNKDLKERLNSAEQKGTDVEREFSQFKASASESLTRQRVEAETDRRKSLESEKRSHAQKASNLQRLRVEAEAIAEGLKADSRMFKEDVEKKEQLIRALEKEKAAFEDKSMEQAERIAQMEQWTISQTAEYDSLKEAVKTTGFDIAQLNTKQKQNDEQRVVDSRIANELEETVGAIIGEHNAVKSRLESYERIEAKVQDFCRKSGISFEVNEIEAILEILARSEIRTSLHDGITSRNNGVDDMAAASHTSNGQATTLIPNVPRLQVPHSPEILDSQMTSVPSSSPLPRRGVRSIAPPRSPRAANVTITGKGSFDEITKKFTTAVSGFRLSRSTTESAGVHRNTALHGPEIEDSQDRGGEFARSPSYSSLSELYSDDFDQINDYDMQPLDRPEDKKGRTEETGRGQRLAAAPEKADNEPPKAQAHNPPSEMQPKKPLKSCLKQTTPRNDLVDDKSMLSSDTVKTALSDPTSTKQSTSRRATRTRLAAISRVQDPIKKLTFDDNIAHAERNYKPDTKQPVTTVQSESSSSQYSARKRTIASASSGIKSEPPAKQARLSLPGRDFQAVSPFIPEAVKRRESSGPSLRSR
ncbi:hypothetical protein V493_07461 [Pseudogymnoascus sp. VKM F-4281 (FW-2241)]|nr:hypothetical protein V493_07461 [Pseudogymnoascus sp. VKM F-4281 (FW-2241)]